MRISIIIPCRNEATHIEKCIKSILEQQIESEEIEIILADGMSQDGTRDVLRELSRQDSRLRIVDNPQQIVSSGLNRAIKSSTGEIIIRMDAHTEYGPDYIRQCVLTLEQTAADNVGGTWVARGEGYIGCAIAAAFQSAFAMGGARGHDPDYEGEVDTVYLGCWRRSTFDRIGLFDEELVRNQDDEFNLRLTRSGGRVWQSPKIRSWYCPRGSLRNLFRQYLQYGYWKVRVIQKHRLPASIRHIIPSGFIATLILLSAAAAFSSVAFYGLMGLMGAYTSCAILGSVIAARRYGFRFLPVLPVVFVCYHFAYGLGFLVGICDFIFLGRASSFAKSLTRSSKQTAAKGATTPPEN